ncbi:hypothetical protein [Rhodococcus sp. p52]|nr:hypothetical protein [Rhodococcus sp. p52]
MRTSVARCISGDLHGVDDVEVLELVSVQEELARIGAELADRYAR